MKGTLAALAVSVCCVVLLAARRGPSPEMPKWEYRTIWDQTDTAKLNALGRDGWELVAVHTAIMNGTTAREVGWLFFKRPLPQ